MAFLKDNGRFLILVLLVLLASSVILFQEQNDTLEIVNYCLIGLIILPFFFQKVDNAVWIIIALTPISVGATLPFLSLRLSIPSELLAVLLLMVFGVKLLLGLKINKQLFYHPITILLLLDISWSAVSAFQSELTEVAIKRLLMKLLFIGVFYFIFANRLDNVKKQTRLFLLYALGAIYPIFHAISVHANRGFGYNTAFDISAPYFTDHTLYGACLAFVLPFLVLQAISLSKAKARYHWLVWMLTLLFVVAIILSYSRASWISLMVAAGFVVLIKLRVRLYHLLGGLAIVVTIILLNFNTIYDSLRTNETKYGDDFATHLSSVSNLHSDASNLERINRWVCAYRMFEDKPIVGFGPGTYQFVYDRYQTPEFMTRISTHDGDRGNAHSEYMSALSETGFIGLFVLIVMLFYILHMGLSILRSPLDNNERLVVLAALLGVITFFTHGLFNTFSDIDKMGVLLYGSIGILVVYDVKRVNNLKR